MLTCRTLIQSSTPLGSSMPEPAAPRLVRNLKPVARRRSAGLPRVHLLRWPSVTGVLHPAVRHVPRAAGGGPGVGGVHHQDLHLGAALPDARRGPRVPRRPRGAHMRARVRVRSMRRAWRGLGTEERVCCACITRKIPQRARRAYTLCARSQAKFFPAGVFGYKTPYHTSRVMTLGQLASHTSGAPRPTPAPPRALLAGRALFRTSRGYESVEMITVGALARGDATLVLYPDAEHLRFRAGCASAGI